MTADGIERIAVVVAQAGPELFALTVRTRPTDARDAEVDRILGSSSLS
ncbi:MAG: hypothetical protein OEW77_06865 [Gemmatimonadota bacterium]|nr:hypothetical protein [Gemmatimonadota bacterium]